MDEREEIVVKIVEISNYEIKRTIGSGTFGRIKLGKLKNDDKYVAVKILKKGKL